MPGKDLDAVCELGEPVQALEKFCGAFLGVDGEVGSRGIADEERVAGEHEPRIGRARLVDRRRTRNARGDGPACARLARAASRRPPLDRRAVPRGDAKHPQPRGSQPSRRTGSRDDRAPRHGRHGCASRAPARARDRVVSSAATTGSIAYGGSTTIATCSSSSPIKYEAHPRSSSRNCRKITLSTLATTPAFLLEVRRRCRSRRRRGARSRAQGRRRRRRRRPRRVRRSTPRARACACCCRRSTPARPRATVGIPLALPARVTDDNLEAKISACRIRGRAGESERSKRTRRERAAPFAALPDAREPRQR